MSAIDVEKLLLPVTDESPCGDDLEYDPAFQELERTASIDASASMVGEESEPEPPNWREVAKQAETLLGQTKDLRAAMYLTKARLDTHGVIGLGDGIGLIKGLLTNYWDDVHPKLSEEDDNDPTMRINSILSLVDAEEVIRQLRHVPLVHGKRAGSYSLHDIRVANGEIAAPGGSEPPEMGIINAAFQESELEDLQASADSVKQAIDDLQAIEGHLTEQVGPENNTLTVKPLVDELIGIGKIYADRLEARGVDVEPMAEPGGAREAGSAPAAISGEITSREDAIRMLDKVSEYFRRNEPSSPVPMLLQRAKGLIAKDFMEILRDLTPDAISQAEVYSRPANKE
jgi:type VI secretion system protein ImpA